jgi:hypothetical protein
MDAPETRLSEVLTKLNDKLARLKKPDADNLRKSFDAAVTAASDDKGICDGYKLLKSLRKSIVDALPEGSIQDAADKAVDRVEEEVRYRGEDWCRAALAQTFRELVKVFAA